MTANKIHGAILYGRDPLGTRPRTELILFRHKPDRIIPSFGTAREELMLVSSLVLESHHSSEKNCEPKFCLLVGAIEKAIATHTSPHHINTMLGYFKPMSADEKVAQLQRLKQQADAAAALHASSIAAAAAAALLVKPGPGRPRRPAPLLDAVEVPATKRHNIDWFSRSDLIQHILSVHRQTGFSSYLTVRQLQRIPLIYDNLSRSTIDSWFKDKKLLPPYQARLDNNIPSQSGSGGGVMRVFSRTEQSRLAEQSIKRQLHTLREQGATINVMVTKYIMQAVLEERCPGMLEQFKLSNTFVKDWLRNEMQYSWRARTTAASKLPANWKELGVDMAKRIAVNMHQYSVSAHKTCYSYCLTMCNYSYSFLFVCCIVVLYC